jgi:predicted DNA binding protein
MREVSLSWSKTTLATTEFRELGEIVSNLKVMGHLAVEPSGVRQIVLPTYHEEKSVADLDGLDFISVEQKLNERESDAVVIWNRHPLVCLASNTENIHILPPYEFDDGAITVNIRGLPEAISTFVKLCKMVLEPDEVRVHNVQSSADEITAILTPRQNDCFALASKHGYYKEPKLVTIQGLAEYMDIARSTYQEHLQGAEQAILEWFSEQIE